MCQEDFGRKIWLIVAQKFNSLLLIFRPVLYASPEALFLIFLPFRDESQSCNRNSGSIAGEKDDYLSVCHLLILPLAVFSSVFTGLISFGTLYDARRG